MYTVTIKQKHCVGNSFSDCYDCGLARAIREQLPEIEIRTVGAVMLHSNDNGVLYFNANMSDGWTKLRFDQLRAGNISDFTVVLYPTQKELTDFKKKQNEAVAQANDIINTAKHHILYDYE